MKILYTRQYLIGGVDLLNTEKPAYKQGWAIEKAHYIKDFYNYCQDCGV